MMNITQNAKGPARIAVLPSHGSSIPQKDIEMNEATNTTAPAATPVPVKEWDLLKTIYTYKGEWNSYLARSLDDKDTPHTYEESLTALENWSEPAFNFCEAEAALLLALEFYEAGDSEVIPNMIKAAKDWMRNDAQRRAYA